MKYIDGPYAETKEPITDDFAPRRIPARASIRFGFRMGGLKRTPAGDELNDQHDQRDDQQQVNQATANLREKADQPQNQDDH
jgi:hypothetical protein